MVHIRKGTSQRHRTQKAEERETESSQYNLGAETKYLAERLETKDRLAERDIQANMRQHLAFFADE